MRSTKMNQIKVRELFWNLLIGLCSIAFSMLMFETGVRFYDHLSRWYIQSNSTTSTIDLASMNYNDGAVYKSKKQDFRVLSFGDSFAYGIVKHQYTYHGYAEKILNMNKKESDQYVRIVNLGEPATSFPQYIRAYRYWSSIIEHDAVIFNVYLGNDLLDVAYNFVETNAEINRVFGKLPFNIKTGLPRLVIPRKHFFRAMDYLEAYYLLYAADMSKPIGMPNDEHYNAALSLLPSKTFFDVLHVQMDNFDPKSLAKLARGYQSFVNFVEFLSSIHRDGKKVLIMLAPNQAQVESGIQNMLKDRYNINMDKYDFLLPIKLMELIASHLDSNIPVINLLPSLKKASLQGHSLYYKTDTHWSLEGNEVVGKELAFFMASRWVGFHRWPFPLVDGGIASSSHFGHGISGSSDDSCLELYLETLGIKSALKGLDPIHRLPHFNDQ